MSLRLSPSEIKIISTPLYDCTEEEKLYRKSVLQRIQHNDEKKNYYLKRHKKIQSRIQNAEKILRNKNIANSTKFKVAKHLGKFLLQHGKTRFGLEYIKSGIEYMQEYKDTDSHALNNEIVFYEKMRDR